MMTTFASSSLSSSRMSSSALATSISASGTGATGSGGSGLSSCCLKALVVSAYDLPNREPPLYVQVRIQAPAAGRGASSRAATTITLASARTGPPVQRHKDRNSFKFDTSRALELRGSGSNNSLESWYEEGEVVVEVHCQASPVLSATYPVKELKIREPEWLILTLEGSASGGSGTTDTTTASSSFESVQPTIRLQLTLEGPYRPEVSALLGLMGAWFALVEGAESACGNAFAKVPLPKIDKRLLLIPAVPGAAAVIVVAPILLGILTLGLPVFLPILVLAGIAMAAIGCVVVVTWSSTPSGRKQIGGLVGDSVAKLLRTPAGQQFVYATGPRPSPVSLTRTVAPTGMHQKLLWSLAIDAIGSSSYLIPFAGESFDVAWAPLQTILIMALYEHVTPNLKYMSFVEEIIPFTDAIPSATLGWLAEFAYPIAMNALGMAPPQSSIPSAAGTATTSNSATASGVPPMNKRSLSQQSPERTDVAE